MKILVAFEESQEVCKAFRKKGHEAFSCDIQYCSGGHPEWHILGDYKRALSWLEWDIVIAHPPCTYLTRTCHQNRNDTFRKLIGYRDLEEIIYIYNHFEKVCIENPQGLLTSYWRKPDQYIQPYHFGHPESKRTGLWLKNLPILLNTFSGNEIINHSIYKCPPRPDRSKIRSKTFPGIAQAMAMQWG